MTAVLEAGPSRPARLERRDPRRPGAGPLVARRRRHDDEPGADVRAVVRAVGCALVAVALWQVWPQTVGGPMAYVRVSGTSMEPGLRAGDLVAVRRRDAYGVGDVIAYRVPNGQVGARQVVIHRIVAGDARTGWTTLGDNRATADPWLPQQRDVVGEMVWSSAGRGDDLQRLAQPVPLGLLCGGLTTLVLVWPDRRSDRRPAPSVPLVLDGLRLIPSVVVHEVGRVVVRFGAETEGGVAAVPAFARTAAAPTAVPPQRPTPGRVVVVRTPRGPVAVASV